MNIFITGATGFLGQHIARQCVAEGHHVLCLRRATSPHTTLNGVTWVTSDSSQWESEVKAFCPDVLIHAAWSGVDAKGRNDGKVQQENVEMTEHLLHMHPYKQVVMLGSQDEYGRIDSEVDENQPLRPLSEYAKAKISCCEHLQAYAGKHGLAWQWLRIFSVYGPGQRPQWLIPSVIGHCLRGEAMDTTRGEQRYSYLYVADFARAVVSTLGKKGKSGIYNLSSAVPVTLSTLFHTIRQLTASTTEFRPTLPYRENQSMTILGNANKFIHAFGPFERTSLEDGLKATIEYIQNNQQL